MSKAYAIGIGGGTCSGKTTLTERLCTLLDAPVQVIHMDAYFKNPIPTTVAPITRKVYVEHNHPDGLDLKRMYADFNEALAKGGIVIIEGLFALHLDEIREKLDLKVFVDLKSDERLVRRITRFRTRNQTFEEITERYLDTVRFRHDELVEPSRWHADLILNGTLDRHKGAEILACYINSQTGK